MTSDDTDAGGDAAPTSHGVRGILRGAAWSLREAARSHPRWLLLTCLTSLILALLPALQVRAVGWLVQSATEVTWTEALVPLIVLTLLVALSELISSAENLTGQRASLRLRTALTRRVGSVAAALTPGQIADPRLHALVEGSRNSTFEIARAPVSVISSLSAVVAAAALGIAIWPYSAIAALLIMLALVPSLITFSWAARMQDEQFELEARHEHRARYLLDQIIDQRTATELRTLGSSHKVAQQAGAARSRAAQVADGIYARLLRGDLLGALVTAVLLGGALVAVLAAGSGPAGLAAGVLGVIAGLQATRGAGFALGDVISAAPRIARFRQFERIGGASESRPVIADVRSLHSRDLTVRYPGADGPALKGASLDIERGQMIALVGVNGAGKTTLVNALLGLVDLEHGTIEIDGRDASALTTVQRLAHFGLATQEFGRYEMTVRDAVALGSPRPDVPEEEIWAALDAARAGTLVRRLPEGLDTMLGPQFDGVGLSGGQWQRIALARIHLRGAGIRVLDEPTSAIDAEAEQEVFAQLRETAADHLTIVVSPRAWTLRGMDRIHVLEDGRIIEAGTFEELMAGPTRFAEVFAEQVRG